MKQSCYFRGQPHPPDCESPEGKVRVVSVTTRGLAPRAYKGNICGMSLVQENPLFGGFLRSEVPTPYDLETVSILIWKMTRRNGILFLSVTEDCPRDLELYESWRTFTCVQRRVAYC